MKADEGFLMGKAWAVVLAVLATVGCHHEATEKSGSDPNRAHGGQAWLTSAEVEHAGVSTQKLVPTQVGATIVAEGHVTYDDLHVTHIFPPVTGRITRIDAHLGERVKKGQALAAISSPDLGVASSDVDKARADLVAAERDAKRQHSLFNQKAASERDWDNAEDAYERAKAEYNRAVKKNNLLRGAQPEDSKNDAMQDKDGDGRDDVTQDYILRSPIDGEVVARTVNPGSEVQGQYSGGASGELFTVGQLDHVWVLADIFEKDVARVKKGQSVVITLPSDPNAVFEGTVDWVSSVLDPSMRTATVRCVIQNAQRQLKPEMFATVRIQSVGTPMLTVPRDSVVRMGDKTVVFVQSGPQTDGRLLFERRPVIVDDAVENEPRVPVLHGLDEGDTVVTAGASKLAEQI